MSTCFAISDAPLSVYDAKKEKKTYRAKNEEKQIQNFKNQRKNFMLRWVRYLKANGNPEQKYFSKSKPG